MRSLNHLGLGIWMVSLIFSSAVANAAEVKVLSDSPLEPALVGITEAFRRESGHEVKFVFELSPVIHKRVTDGETADVIIIQPNFIDEFVKSTLENLWSRRLYSQDWRNSSRSELTRS